MPYLRLHDYLKQIQSENLQQIISQDDSIRTDSENVAIDELSSYLRQKYDLSSEFRNVLNYDHTSSTYKAGDSMQLDSPLAWAVLQTYTKDFIVSRTNKIYYSKAAGNVGHDPALDVLQTYWGLLGDQYTLYNAIIPKPRFLYETSYEKGAEVFYKDKIYTCQISVVGIAPDDSKNGLMYWGTGTAYTIPAGSLLNINFIMPGDGRSQQIVVFLIDITLYHIHKRIAPRNIPDLRVKAYDDAISWLKNCAKGTDITPNLLKLTPRSGGRFRWGSSPKQINTY